MAPVWLEMLGCQILVSNFILKYLNFSQKRRKKGSLLGVCMGNLEVAQYLFGTAPPHKGYLSGNRKHSERGRLKKKMKYRTVDQTLPMVNVITDQRYLNVAGFSLEKKR